MNKLNLLNKSNILFTILSFIASFNSYAMEQFDKAKQEEKQETKVAINQLKVLQLQKTTRLGSVQGFSAELCQFMNDKAISLERVEQQKVNPELLDLDISAVREQIEKINLKLAELYRLESLLAISNPHAKEITHKKRKHKPTFSSVARQAKKVKKKTKINTANTEQKLNVIKKLLDKEHTKGLRAEKRLKLNRLIVELSDADIEEYINSLDRKIEKAKEQIKLQPLNCLKLNLIKQAHEKEPSTPRNLPSQTKAINPRIARAHTLSTLPLKKEE